METSIDNMTSNKTEDNRAALMMYKLHVKLIGWFHQRNRE